MSVKNVAATTGQECPAVHTPDECDYGFECSSEVDYVSDLEQLHRNMDMSYKKCNKMLQMKIKEPRLANWARI